MSSLANTKWNGANRTWEFNSDGTMTETAPNGQVFTFYYSETSNPGTDSTFVLQTPNGTVNPNITEVYTGQHTDGAMNGYYISDVSNNASTLATFQMQKV